MIKSYEKAQLTNQKNQAIVQSASFKPSMMNNNQFIPIPYAG